MSSAIEISLETAAAIDSLVEGLRASALKLAQENDRLRAENKRLAHENGDLLDQLHAARTEATRVMTTGGS